MVERFRRVTDEEDVGDAIIEWLGLDDTKTGKDSEMEMEHTRLGFRFSVKTTFTKSEL